MPDHSVALVTDPPYGIGITRSHRISVERGFDSSHWDDCPATPEMIAECLRVAKSAVIWGGNYFGLPPTRCMLVWDKQNDGRDFAEAELAWTNLDEVVRVFRQRPQGMDGGKVHPTQKPTNLMRWVIQNYTDPELPVFDPFMGSGSTGVACVELGRDFIGCEITERYYLTAERRIHDAQPSIF